MRTTTSGSPWNCKPTVSTSPFSEVSPRPPAKGTGGDFVTILQTGRPEEGGIAHPQVKETSQKWEASIHHCSTTILQEQQNCLMLLQLPVEQESSSTTAMAHNHPTSGWRHRGEQPSGGMFLPLYMNA